MADFVFPGQPLSQSPLRSARVVNKVLRAATAFAEQSELGDAEYQKRFGGHAGIVNVRNETGGDLPLGAVVELDAYLLDEEYIERKWFWFSGVQSTGKPQWGVYQLPAKDDRFGPAVIAGKAVALVNVTDTAHEFARVESGQTVLKSCLGRGDVRILDNPGGGTGTKLCPVVILPKFRIFRGVTAEEIEGSSSGDVLLTEPNKTEAVYNPFASTIAEDEPVLVAEVDGQLTMWYPGEGTTGGGTEPIRLVFSSTEDMDATTVTQMAATVVKAVGTGAPAESASIVVHDDLLQFADVMNGARGYAVNFGTASEPHYVVVACRRVAIRVRMRCTESICATDTGDVSARLAEHTWQTVEPYSHNPAAADIVVTNPAGHAAFKPDSSDPDGDFVWAERVAFVKDGNSKWQFQIYKVEKHEGTLITGMEMVDDEGTMKFRATGKKVSVEVCGDADPIDIFIPAQRTYVTGGSYDSGSHELRLTREKAWVFHHDTETHVVQHTMVSQDVVVENSVDGLNFRYTPMTVYVPEKDTAKTPVNFHTGTNQCPTP